MTISASRLPGYGTTFSYSSTGFNVDTGELAAPTELSAITKIQLPAGKVSNTPTHSLGTVGAVTGQPQVKTTQPGWIDTDKIDVTVYFSQAQFGALLDIFLAGTELYWQAEFPLAAGETVVGFRVTVPGYIQSQPTFEEINVDDDNLIMSTFSIKANDVIATNDGS